MSTAVFIDASNVIYNQERRRVFTLDALVSGLRRRFGERIHIWAFALDAEVFEKENLQRLRADRNITLLTTDSQFDGEALNRSISRWRDIGVAMCDVVVALAGPQKLILVSNDREFQLLLRHLTGQGIATALVCSPDLASASIATAAGELIELEEVPRGAEGLVAPGTEPSAMHALVGMFRAARQEVLIIDPYVGEATIRMLSWCANHVGITVIGMKVDPESVVEARSLVAAGRSVKLFKGSGFHDRWFRVDGRWWFSGASLKDLGKKYSQISAVESSLTSEYNEMADSLKTSATRMM